MTKGQSLQDPFLNALRRERVVDLEVVEDESATVQVHGVSISSLSISKSPSASITFRTTSTATVTWRKYVANNVYNSGNVYAGYTSTYVSVNSCGSGNGPGGYGLVSSKCVYAGAL